MASRKPKGIADDIVGGIRDIVSPWLGTPPGEARQVTQGKALARGAAETLDQTFAGGMVKAGVQGNAALAKQAGVNAAALGAGYVAGKVVQKVVPVVKNRLQTVVPILENKLGKEIGVHLSNTDNLKNIKFSPDRVGIGSEHMDVEIGQTYKFAPYAGRHVGQRTGGVIHDSPYDFAGTVAGENINMAVISEEPTKAFAYITKSRRGEIDDAYGFFSNARMVPKQKVTSKVTLPRVGVEEDKIVTRGETDANFDEVRKVLYDALLKREQITQSNLRSTLNTVRGATGVAAQKTGTELNKKKGRGSGVRK